MLIKPITFETYDDVPQTITQNYCFNISKREWMHMNIADEPMEEVLQKIIDSKSSEQIVKYLEEIVLKAYGVRTLNPETGKMDGFDKSPEVVEKFKTSAAFTQLIEDMLMGDSADNMADFIIGVLPKEVTSNPEFIKEAAASRAKANEEIAKARAEAAAEAQPPAVTQPPAAPEPAATT